MAPYRCFSPECRYVTEGPNRRAPKGRTRRRSRSRWREFFEATLNGDVAALDDYVSDACDQKAEFLKSAEVLRILEAVDVAVPEGAMLFDFDEEGGFAVAKRAREGPALPVNGEPIDDDPSNDVPLQLVREESTWRVMNCDQYVPE